MMVPVLSYSRVIATLVVWAFIRRPAPAAAVCRRWVVVVVEHWAVGSEVTREPEFRFRIAGCGVGIRILQLAPDCCYR